MSVSTTKTVSGWAAAAASSVDAFASKGRVFAGVLGLITLAALVGCGPVNPRLQPDGIGPLVFNDALFYLDTQQSAGVVVDPKGQAGPYGNQALHRIPMGPSPTGFRVAPFPGTPNRQQVLVVDPKGERVHVVRGTTGVTDVLHAGVPLQAIDVTPDGRYGLAYEPDGAHPSRTLFTFPNAVAVLDLQTGAPKATTVRLGQSGARPVETAFGRTIQLMPATQKEPISMNVGLVFVPGGVMPIDLARARRGELLPLKLDADTPFTPHEVIFTNNRGDTKRRAIDAVERVFVMSQEGYVFSLRIELGPDGQGFVLEQAQRIALGSPIFDIELTFDAKGRGVLLAAAGDHIFGIDVDTGDVERFGLSTPVDTLVRYDDPESERELVLAYSDKEPQRTVLRLLPRAFLEAGDAGIQSIRLGEPVARVQIGQSGKLAVVVYDDTSQLGVMALRRGEHEVLDIQFAATPSAYELVNEGQNLLVVTRSPEARRFHLAEISLDGALESREIALDGNARAVGEVDGFYWIDHGTPLESVTFVPKARMHRQAAIRVDGILATDVLEHEPPQQ